jgi:hypothetical protein
MTKTEKDILTFYLKNLLQNDSISSNARKDVHDIAIKLLAKGSLRIMAEKFDKNYDKEHKYTTEDIIIMFRRDNSLFLSDLIYEMLPKKEYLILNKVAYIGQLFELNRVELDTLQYIYLGVC